MANQPSSQSTLDQVSAKAKASATHPQDSAVVRELERARTIAWWLDNSIELPIIKRRIGIDSLIGMVPIVGDIVGYLISLIAVQRARKFGASFGTLMTMIANILIEAIVGLVPFFGDLFDMAWKSNTKNVKLLEEHLTELQASPKRGFSLRDAMWLGGIFTLIVSACIGTVMFWLWGFGLI